MSGDVALVSALERIASGLERLAAYLEREKKLPALAQSASSPAPAKSILTKAVLEVELVTWVGDLEIVTGLDSFNIRPKRYLHQTWSQVNEVIRSRGGQWISNGKEGYWRIEK